MPPEPVAQPVAEPAAQRGVERQRPNGQQEVTEALKAATFELLAAHGVGFSVRDAAERAGVNHALIYRHFGSKENMIRATIADVTEDLSSDLRAGVSPVDLVISKGPAVAAVTARLILDDATSLIDEHPAIAAILDAARQADSTTPLPAESRAALAIAVTLGWSVFGRYCAEAAAVDDAAPIEDTLREFVDGLIGRADRTG